MKKIYFLLIILLIMVCTGCKVKYNLEIKEDLTVNEEVTALEDDEFFSQYPKSSISRVIELVMSMGKEYLDVNNYKVEKIIGKNSGVKITHEFNSFDEYYKTSKFYAQLFSDFGYKKEGNIIKLNLEGEINKDLNIVDRYLIDEAVINIKIPFLVISNNADKYDSKTNTYTWIIDEETDYKKIFINFDTSKKYFKYKKIVYICIPFVLIMSVAIFIHIRKKINLKNQV